MIRTFHFLLSEKRPDLDVNNQQNGNGVILFIRDRRYNPSTGRLYILHCFINKVMDFFLHGPYTTTCFHELYFHPEPSFCDQPD